MIYTAESMADLHDLGTLCRVCGERLRKTKSKAVVYTCAEHEDQLSATFGIAISSDTVDIHPPQFCNRCYSVTQRQRTAAASSLPYRHSVKVFEWKAHKENECTVSTIKILFCKWLIFTLMNLLLGLPTYPHT